MSFLKKIISPTYTILRRMYKVDKLYQDPNPRPTKKMCPKHWNPRYRRLRAKKFLYTELVDTDMMRNQAKMTPEEIRAKMKKDGTLPSRPYLEKQIHISSSGGILEPFIPPEGDGYSVQLKVRAKDQTKEIMLKGKSMLDSRKMKRMDPEFDIKSFPALAQDIYIKAHEALKVFDEKLLHQYVTEKAYIDMTLGLEYSTIDWEFVESIEAPRVVHVRAFNLVGKTEDFGQITVRFHTKQRLGIYDRFGRLAYGTLDSTRVRDVLEYVVFENHLADQYGSWRLHGKTVPDWVKVEGGSPNQILRTFRKDLFADADENKSLASDAIEAGATDGSKVSKPDTDPERVDGKDVADKSSLNKITELAS